MRQIRPVRLIVKITAGSIAFVVFLVGLSILSAFVPVPVEKLELKNPKTVFKPDERPRFKVDIGETEVQKSGIAKIAKKILPKEFNVYASTMPEIKATAKREWDQEGLPVAISRTGTEELEVKVMDAASFKPGKYQLQIKSGYRNITQDFTWGVLAINTNKSIYKAGETAKIGMAVLDDFGRTKCMVGDTGFKEAKLWLTITTPNGIAEELSTENGRIKDSGQCSVRSITNEADFQANYETSIPGTYQMHYEAENQNGRRTIDDFFVVEEKTPYFDVERTSLPTRIYPGADYTNTITVTSKGDFTGQVVETVPASFSIDCFQPCQIIGESGREPDNRNLADRSLLYTIIWDVDLKAGQPTTFSYTFDPPNASPEFFLLGPLQIYDTKGSTLLFSEIRQWQIAADAIITWDGGGADENWSTGGNWSDNADCSTSADVCTFDATSTKNATMNVAALSVTGIDINSGYTGTITQSGANTITLTTSAFTQSAGTFTGGSGAITVTDNTTAFTIDGGIHTSTTGDINVERSFSFTGGTFTNNTNSVDFEDSSATDDSTLTCASILTGTWNVNKDAGGDFILSANCTVTVAEEVASDIGTLTNNGTLTLGGTSTTFDTNDSSIDNNGTMTINSGVTVTTQRDFDNTGGTLTNNGTVVFDDNTSTDASTFTCNNAPGGTFRLDKSSIGAFTLSTGCTITVEEAVVSSIGTLTNNGTLTMGGTSTTFDTNDSSIDNNGTMTINSGVTVTTQRDFDNTGGTLTNNGTVVFDDSSSTDASTMTCNNAPGGTFSLDKTAAGAFTLSTGCTITVTEAVTSSIGTLTNNGTLTLSNGTFDLTDSSTTNAGTMTINSDATLKVDRNFNSTGATLTNNGSIIFDDSSSIDDTTFTCDDTINGVVYIDKANAGDMVINDGTGGDCVVTSVQTNATTSNVFTFTNQGTITFTDTTDDININDATATNTGSITINANVTLNFERNFDNSGATLVNNGSIIFDDSSSIDSTTFTCDDTINGVVYIDKTSATSMTINDGTGGDCVITSIQTNQVSSNVLGLTNQGTITFTDTTDDININDAAFTNSGTVTNNAAGGIFVERNFSDTGTIVAGTGTWTFDESSSLDETTLTCGASSNLGAVTINKVTAGPSVTPGSNCSMGNLTRTDGPIDNPASAYTWKVDGNVSITTTDLEGGTNLTFSMEGSSAQTIAINTALDTFDSKFQVNKSANSARLTTYFTTASTCTVVEGTFDIDGQAFSCGSTFTVEDGGNFQLHGLINSETSTTPTLNSGSTVTFNGDGDGINDTVTITSLVATYHHLTINSDGSVDDTFQLGAALDVNGSLTITNGTFDVTATNYNVTIGDDFTNSDSVNFRSNTVTFDTAASTSILSYSAATTFSSLTISTASKPMQFDDTYRTNVTGTLTINGAACGTQITLDSETTGNQFELNATGTVSVDYADIQDSYAVTTLTATNSKNAGNNIGWSIGIGSCSSTQVQYNAGTVIQGGHTISGAVTF